jgi:ferredoxin-type protein NapG
MSEAGPKGEGGRNGRRLSRRRFCTEAAAAAAGVSLAVLGLQLYAQKAEALPYDAIRPPGALPAGEFLAACLRCGQCVRACPYQVLKLATVGDEVPTGTPYFVGRDNPCRLCEDLPCVRACPSGALDSALKDVYQARMGLAVLVDRENCLNAQGLRCDVCYRACPLLDQAITLEIFHNPRSDRHALFMPTVHSGKCTGCGICERACVLEQAAIKVLPLAQAKGELGHHYRLGWQEKEEAGGPLIGDLLHLPTRQPEGGGL